jgi:hypothetical protein
MSRPSPFGRRRAVQVLLGLFLLMTTCLVTSAPAIGTAAATPSPSPTPSLTDSEAHERALQMARELGRRSARRGGRLPVHASPACHQRLPGAA